MPGGMQAGMQLRIGMRILGCMHPGMLGVIKCLSACSLACIPGNSHMYFYENCHTRAACPRHAGGMPP